MKKSQKILTLISLLAVFLILANWQLSRLIQKKHDEGAKLYGELNRQATWEEEVRVLERTIEEITVTRASLASYYINNSDTPKFIESMEGMARKAGVQFKWQSFNDPVKDGFFRMNFEIHGNFGQVFHLLRLLEALPYRLEINKAVLEKENGSLSEANIWKGTFVVTLLSFVK